MGRKPREDVAGAVHHVYARGVRRTPLFVDDGDHRAYLQLLGRTRRRYDWRCLAYCLMPNHVHLLIETPRATLCEGMSWLHGGYARAFNRRHGTRGHVFEARYGSKRLVTDGHLLMVVGYIAHNPVAAGLCATAGAWRWGSHATIEAGEMPTWLAHGRLLELLSGGGGDPNARYNELVHRER